MYVYIISMLYVDRIGMLLLCARIQGDIFKHSFSRSTCTRIRKNYVFVLLAKVNYADDLPKYIRQKNDTFRF